MTGTFLSQIIPILIAPLLSRLYVPADYGIFGLFLSIGVLINVFSTLQYSTAIVLPTKENEAETLVRLSVVIALAISLISLAVISLVYINGRLVWSFEMPYWIWLLPLNVLFTGLTNALTYYAIRQKKFKGISFSRIYGAISTAVISIGLGLFKFHYSGLLLGYMIGQMVSTAVLLRSCPIENLFKEDIRKLKMIAAVHSNFPKFNLFTDFVYSLINQIPVFMLKQVSTLSAVGHYNVSNRLLGLPVMVLSSSVSEVFRQRAAHDYNNTGSCRAILIKTTITLFSLSIIPFTVIFFFGSEIFGFVLGENWTEAGVYAQVMSLMFFFRFIVSPLTFVYYIRKRHKENLFMSLLMVVVGFGSIFLGDYFCDEPKNILLFFSLGYSLLYLIYFLRSYKLSQ